MDMQLDNTYQLNFGGNSDFYNMLERERLDSKKISKKNLLIYKKEEKGPSFVVGQDYILNPFL